MKRCQDVEAFTRPTVTSLLRAASVRPSAAWPIGRLAKRFDTIVFDERLFMRLRGSCKQPLGNVVAPEVGGMEIAQRDVDGLCRVWRVRSARPRGANDRNNARGRGRRPRSRS